MNILFILPEYYPHSGGGISTYYLQYIKALRPFCKSIKVIVGSGYVQTNEVFEIDGVNIEYLKPAIYQRFLSEFTRYDAFPEFRNNIAAAWAMYEQANRGDGYDIIECTDFGLGFIPWVTVSKLPVVTRLHGSSGQIALHENNLNFEAANHLYQLTELQVLPLSGALVSHSTANAHFWENTFSHTSVKVIPPVYTAQQDILPLAQRHSFGLVTARIQKWKGAVELCRAMENVAQGQVKWYGRDMPFDKQQTTQQYLASAFPAIYNKKVLFEGATAQDKISSLQRKAKFGIIPSTWDMFNFTGLEFMAAGTPISCADGAGVSELIDNGVNGFKYPSHNTEALAEHINSFAKMDDAAYSDMARAARATIVDKLSPEKIIPLNLELYKQVQVVHKALPANSFLNNIYSPNNLQANMDQLLNSQPLSTLFPYVLKRALAKLWKR